MLIYSLLLFHSEHCYFSKQLNLYNMFSSFFSFSIGHLDLPGMYSERIMANYTYDVDSNSAQNILHGHRVNQF